MTSLMASLAHSCPVLEVIDFSDVTSLSPESLIYLCYQVCLFLIIELAFNFLGVFFQDTYLVLHKYMYLHKFCVDSDGLVFHDLDDLEAVEKHGLVRRTKYCPWCIDPGAKLRIKNGCAFDVNSAVFVLDDRLFDYIEAGLDDPRSLLVNCVKVSHLNKAFNDLISVLEPSKPPESHGNFSTRPYKRYLF